MLASAGCWMLIVLFLYGFKYFIRNDGLMGVSADDSCFMGNDRQLIVQTNVGAIALALCHFGVAILGPFRGSALIALLF